jgi:hypothetical protein
VSYRHRDKNLGRLAPWLVQQKEREIQRLQNSSQNVSSAPDNSQQSRDAARIRHDARKACEARLKPLTPGTNIVHHMRESARILTTEGAVLSQDEQIDILRNKTEIDREVSLRVQDKIAGNPPRTRDEYVQIVCELFAPRHESFLLELKYTTQRDSTTAVDHMKHIRKLSVKNWMTPPSDLPTVTQIIDNMSSKHRDYMQRELRAFATTERAVKGGQCTNISFDNLEMWAANSDERVQISDIGNAACFIQ